MTFGQAAGKQAQKAVIEIIPASILDISSFEPGLLSLSKFACRSLLFTYKRGVVSIVIHLSQKFFRII